MGQLETRQTQKLQPFIFSPDLLPSVSVLWKLWLLLVALLAVGMYVAPEPTVVVLIGLGIVLPLIGLAWQQPEWGMIGLTAITSSFFSPNIIDVRLPIGGLDLRDLILLGTLGLLFVQHLARGTFRLPWLSVSIPLILFIAWSVTSAVYAIVWEGVAANVAFNEFRPLFYFSSFFVAAWGLQKRSQLRTLFIGLFILADITTLLIIAQQFLGVDNPLLTAMGSSEWRVWRMGSGSTFGSVRVIPPGHVLMFIMTIVAFSLMISERQTPRNRLLYGFQFVFINGGLLLTYTRSQWVASGIALILVALFLPFSDKTRILRYSLQAFVVLLIGYSLFNVEIQGFVKNMPFIESFVNRLTSIFTPAETLDTYSLEWRVFETEEAFRSIGEHPVIGVGLGNSYRDVTLLQGEAAGWIFGSNEYGRYTRYLHNSYLFVTVKLGIVGMGLFAWFAIAYLAGGWRNYVRTHDGTARRITLALVASFVGFLVWSITHSNFFYTESTSIIGFTIGIVAALRRFELAEQPVSPDV